MPVEISDLLKDKEYFIKLNRPRIKIDPKKDLGHIPLLKHIQRLSFEPKAKYKGAKMLAVGIYARRYFDHENNGVLWCLEAAKDSGFEGWSCVDDTARAVALGIKICQVFDKLYKEENNELYLNLKEEVEENIKHWLNFLLYMRNEENKVINFILDFEGTKNTIIENSLPGGFPWASRSLWAFALAYQYFKDKKYKNAYIESFLETAPNMSYLSLVINSALEILDIEPDIKYKNKRVETYLKEWCEIVMEHFDEYFCNEKVKGKLKKDIDTYAYYQLGAMVRAGEYLGEERYIKAADESIKNFIQPNLNNNYFSVFPKQKGNSNIYGISSLIFGLESMFDLSKKGKYRLLFDTNYYRNLALAYTTWLYRGNIAGSIMWYPNEGYCFDNTAIENQGDIYAGTACGAESAIEGGLVQLVINHIQERDKDWLLENYFPIEEYL